MWKILTTIAKTIAHNFPGLGAIPILGQWVNSENLAYEARKEQYRNNYAYTKDIAEKEKLINDRDESIVGLVDPVLRTEATGTLTTTTDFATYPDRAVVQWYNGTGSPITITGASIVGKAVRKWSGENGYVWEYADYDAIEKQGENYAGVSNDFIFERAQTEAIGDYCWKALKPHNVYSLSLVGCQHQYAIGDFYTLAVSYTLTGQPSEAESINVAVEVMNVSFSRRAGEIGQTVLTVRQAMGTWSKSTSRRARLVGAGRSQWLNNRSNVVTVASSTWTGQADYFCDGTNDYVEIQAALDYLNSKGGGLISLTNGTFDITGQALTFYDNIIITGEGYSTKLQVPAIAGLTLNGVENVVIENMTIDCSQNVGNISAIDITDGANGLPNKISNIQIIGITPATILDSYGIYANGSYHNTAVTGCYIGNVTSTAASAQFSAIYGITLAIGNKVGVLSNTSTGLMVGFESCKKCQQNSVANSATVSKYNNSYADAGTSNACADTAAGGYNS